MNQWRSARGIALVITLLYLSMFSALALGLLLSSSAHRLAASNHHHSVALLNAAESAIALATRELAAIADWSAVLGGSRRSVLSDALDPGIRTLPGGVSIDVVAIGHELSCGRVTPCAAAEVRVNTRDRPWGSNNPRWQPFLYTRLDAVVDLLQSDPVYVVVWIGDDARESDDDPLVDGGAVDGAGRHAVRMRAAAFGVAGARRWIETHVTRVCNLVDGMPTCLPGIHVQSWRIVNASLP